MFCPFRHLVAGGDKQRCIGSTHVKHLYPLRLDAHFCQQFLGLLNPFFRSQISFQEMAFAFLSAGNEDGIGSILKGFK